MGYKCSISQIYYHYHLHDAHGSSEQILKLCVFFTFFTVAFGVDKHVVWLVKYFLNLSVCAHVTDLVYLCQYVIGTTSLNSTFCKDSNLLRLKLLRHIPFKPT